MKDLRSWVVTSVFYLVSVKIAWCWKTTQDRKKGQVSRCAEKVQCHCGVLSLCSISFPCPLPLKQFSSKHKILIFCFTEEQRKYWNNLQRCSADIFASSVCGFSSQPKGNWSVYFAVQVIWIMFNINTVAKKEIMHPVFQPIQRNLGAPTATCTGPQNTICVLTAQLLFPCSRAGKSAGFAGNASPHASQLSYCHPWTVFKS